LQPGFVNQPGWCFFLSGFCGGHWNTHKSISHAEKPASIFLTDIVRHVYIPVETVSTFFLKGYLHAAKLPA